jgi:hypothetical protein
VSVRAGSTSASRPDSEIRRRLLKFAGGLLLADTLPSLSPATAASPPIAAERRALAAFLDVLLPADDDTASASALKVDDDLHALAANDPLFKRLVALGCRWLDLTGTVPFADLPSGDQIAIVESMSAADWSEIPRRFYELMRQTAVECYYSRPAALAGLPVQEPPQPAGYPPPWQDSPTSTPS